MLRQNSMTRQSSPLLKQNLHKVKIMIENSLEKILNSKKRLERKSLEVPKILHKSKASQDIKLTKDMSKKEIFKPNKCPNFS